MKKVQYILFFAVFTILSAILPAVPAPDTVFRAETVTLGDSGVIPATSQYVKGAYNANVDNINTALEYVEKSTVATINDAKVSADNVSLNIDSFTPSGTVSIDSSNATIVASVDVPTKIQVMNTWGSNDTVDVTLGGITATNINSGATVTGVTAEFTGTATGNLTGSGAFNDAKVSVDDWNGVYDTDSDGD